MLISYLEDVPGVHPISPGENPATWMLEVTGGASVTGQSRAADVDFAEYYKVGLPMLACVQLSHEIVVKGGSDMLWRVLGPPG